MSSSRMASRFAFSLGVAMAIVSLTPLSAPAQKAVEAEAFFKSGAVVNLDLTIGTAEMEALRREPRTYVSATLKEGEKTYEKVGIHLRGAGSSFRPFTDKPGLTFNTDKFAEKTLFHGLDKFHLCNSVDDPTYVRELLAGELFRAAGLPAPRVGHALVTINGKSKGLYTIKEGYDGAFLKHYFKTKYGNFYDSGSHNDIDQKLEHVSGKETIPPHEDLKKLAEAVQNADPSGRYQRIAKVLDTERFFSFLAMSVLTSYKDGYAQACNNYRVYHNPLTERMVFIPAGMNEMFEEPRSSILPTFKGMVAKAVLETPEGKEKYLARLEELSQTVFRPEQLAKRLDELQSKIQPALAAVDEKAGKDYSVRIERLKANIALRSTTANEQLKKLKK